MLFYAEIKLCSSNSLTWRMTFHKINVQRGVVTKKVKSGFAVLVNVKAYLNATSTIIHHTKLLGGNSWNIKKRFCSAQFAACIPQLTVILPLVLIVIIKN